VALPEALGFTAPPREAPEDEEPARPVLRLVPDPERRTKERRAAKADLAESERALARAERARRTPPRPGGDPQAPPPRGRAGAGQAGPAAGAGSRASDEGEAGGEGRPRRVGAGVGPR